MFIRLTIDAENGKRPIDINVDRIDAIVAMMNGSKIYVGGSDEPFTVMERFECVEELIRKGLNYGI